MKVQTRAGVVCGLTLSLLSSVALSSSYDAALKNRANRQIGNGAQARPPTELEAPALKVVAGLHGVPLADLTVENSTVATYPLSGKRANLFRVGRKSTDDLWEIALDDNGMTVDQSALAAGEEDARTAKYSKLSPFLWEYLSHASPDQEIEVTILVALGPDTDRPRDPVAMDSEKLKRMTEQERQDYVRAEQDFDLRLKAYNIARAQRAIDPVVQRLKKLGYAPKILTDTGGYLTAKMKPAMIRECQTWPEIRQVTHEPNFKATGARSALGSSPSAAPAMMLDISLPLIGADLVENTGINGQNTALAQVESGNNTGRIFNDVGQNNPYLSGIAQDGTFLCSGSPSDHSTAVAGIIHSATLPPVFRGIAPGAGLLATGVCDGNVMNTSDRIGYAISQGALVINHSYGHDTGSLTSNPLAQSDQFLDSKVFTDRVVQVVAGGNESTFATAGNVDSPGKAYNVITVGNLNDNESTNWNNVVVDPTSSIVGPHWQAATVSNPKCWRQGSLSTPQSEPSDLVSGSAITSRTAAVSQEPALPLRTLPVKQGL